ncbi:hypothetical protein Pint_07381 [Pistacia integerrima]|uniref:Uncharacterized protein n=1 Tax=Pistacia integerrima TaxID=434235 RepID=A0ACC0XZ28_9ROSI|nr:hypothetical protein Pint_07381 [Pistacia integerrima]
MTCIFLVWCFLYRTNNREPEVGGYFLAATGFKKFGYTELQKATLGFTEEIGREIGRGAGGVVYKGLLSDGRVAAIKRLKEANQGEAEFLAEVSTIGRLNHMNLIEMWGYCAEGRHRLLVYEYLMHGSLAENLSSKALKCDQLFETAVGTGKGLAYLHEECLEWILHCGLNNSSFSRIRGTRGYMAPEWVYNLPITSKVDVYGYGILLLEMVTGKSPIATFQTVDFEGVGEHGTPVTSVRQKKNGRAKGEGWIEEIVDPSFDCNYDKNNMEIMVRVGLQCVEEDRNVRPSMNQVLEMLCKEGEHDKM